VHPYSAKIALILIFRAKWEDRMLDNRNILYLIVGVLVVVIGVLGYNLYQAKKQPEGLQINVGPNGLKIQNK
jgi:RsiW-degrading membrane proteinase PrsW (M82 family)